MKRKNIIVRILLVVVSLMVCGLSAYAYVKKESANKTEQTTISKKSNFDYQQSIENYTKKFNEATDIDSKINILNQALEEQNKYSGESTEAKEAYSKSVQSLKEKIIEFVNEKIKEYTIENYNPIIDKEKGSTFKQNLEKILEVITKEKTIIFEKNEDFDKINEEIKKLIEEYSKEAVTQNETSTSEQNQSTDSSNSTNSQTTQSRNTNNQTQQNYYRPAQPSTSNNNGGTTSNNSANTNTSTGTTNNQTQPTQPETPSTNTTTNNE